MNVVLTFPLCNPAGAGTGCTGGQVNLTSTSIPAGGSVSGSFVYTIQPSDPDPFGYTTSTTATVRATTTTGSTISDSASVFVDILDDRLQITKTADRTSALRGDTITYDIAVTNLTPDQVFVIQSINDSWSARSAASRPRLSLPQGPPLLQRAQHRRRERSRPARERNRGSHYDSRAVRFDLRDRGHQRRPVVHHGFVQPAGRAGPRPACPVQRGHRQHRPDHTDRHRRLLGSRGGGGTPTQLQINFGSGPTNVPSTWLPSKARSRISPAGTVLGPRPANHPGANHRRDDQGLERSFFGTATINVLPTQIG